MRPLPTGEPWGDYAVFHRRWTAPASPISSAAQAAADSVEVRFEGADHGSYHLDPVLADTTRAP